MTAARIRITLTITIVHMRISSDCLSDLFFNLTSESVLLPGRGQYNTMDSGQSDAYTIRVRVAILGE